MKDWTYVINSITELSRAEFGQLTNEQLHWKPNADTWSIAQNLEHLIVVNETYHPILASLKDGTYKTPFIAKIGFMVSFTGKIILASVQPDRKQKTKTFPIWEPNISQTNDNILERFENHQRILCKKIEDAKEFADKGVAIYSPTNKNIVYKLETAFDIITSHEKRHIEQAKEVLGLLRNNNNG
ncbi:hypothetical protein MASR2M18_07920 [Ignavibacteria bacterium]|nr:DinB family protein [Bacteroidota bacterium]MCZ2132921.1 DinB family protein [Bacteroidota bacterium]